MWGVAYSFFSRRVSPWFSMANVTPQAKDPIHAENFGTEARKGNCSVVSFLVVFLSGVGTRTMLGS